MKNTPDGCTPKRTLDAILRIIADAESSLAQSSESSMRDTGWTYDGATWTDDGSTNIQARSDAAFGLLGWRTALITQIVSELQELADREHFVTQRQERSDAGRER